MNRVVRRVMIAALILFGLGTSGVVCQRIAARGRYAVPYSTYGAGPEGTKGLFIYSEEAGLSPRRWAQDLIGLPKGALLIAIGGCDQAPNRRLSRYEAAAVTDWIETGGVLLVAGASDYLWDDAPIALRAPADCNPEGSLAAELARAERGEPSQNGQDGQDGQEEQQDLGEQFAADPNALIDRLLGEHEEAPPVWADASGILSGLAPIPLLSPGAIETSVEAEVFLSSGKPALPLGVIVRQGEGAIVVVSSASLLQNRDLEGSDGGVVFARLCRALAPGGPLLFDEYHLGVGERRSLGRYIRDMGGAPVVLQLLFVAAVALVGLGVRFGRPVRVPPPIPGGTASFVEGVGSLYARIGDAAAALALVAKQALADVAAHHHAPSVAPAQLAKLLEDRGQKDASAAVQRLGELCAEANIGARKLVERVQEIDRLVARARSRHG